MSPQQRQGQAAAEVRSPLTPMPKSAHPDAHRTCSRDIEDGGGEEDYYAAADLSVGATLNVFGRSLLLYDADARVRRLCCLRDLGMRPLPPTLPYPPSSRLMRGTSQS